MMWLVLLGVLILGAGLILVASRLRGRPASAAPAANAADHLALRDCPKCGNQIAVDWSFCPFCARALVNDDSVVQVSERSGAVASAGRA